MYTYSIKSSYLYFTKVHVFGGICFYQCGNGRFFFYEITNTEQKRILRVLIFLPMIPGGEIDKNHADTYSQGAACMYMRTYRIAGNFLGIQFSRFSQISGYPRKFDP
jgi:hypothetical protein